MTIHDKLEILRQRVFGTISKPVTIRDLIDQYKNMEHPFDVREHCYLIMDKIAAITADSIEEEEKQLEEYEREFKKQKDSLTNEYIFRTKNGKFVLSSDKEEWHCMECGRLFQDYDIKSVSFVSKVRLQMAEHRCNDNYEREEFEKSMKIYGNWM